jgi:hypothetical protein
MLFLKDTPITGMSGDSSKEEKRINKKNSMYLTNYVFRKTYVSIQKAIDDWLRKVLQTEISVAELKRIK